MTPEQIKRDYAEHQKILAKSAFRHVPVPKKAGVVLTPDQCRGLDAANSAAHLIDDPESDPFYGNRQRTITRRLCEGLALMERYGIEVGA